MPPPSSSSGITSGGNAGAMVASLCQAAEHKQGQLRQQVSANHGHARAAAQHLAVNGNVQRLLESLCPDILSEKDVHYFLAEQRDRLRQVAVQNARNEGSIRAFAHACGAVRQDALRRSGSGEPLPDDYCEVVAGLMSAQTENLANHASVQKFVHEIKVQLREEKEMLPGGDGDDDDIELVDAGNGAGGGTTQGSSLKCPLTSALLEEPCRNRKCGHVYSKEAILGYLKTQRSNRRPCKCPTAGCDNLHVTEDQLEKDAMLEIAVNRERRRIDKQKLDRASQASQVEDDEDEGEELF